MESIEKGEIVRLTCYGKLYFQEDELYVTEIQDSSSISKLFKLDIFTCRGRGGISKTFILKLSQISSEIFVKVIDYKGTGARNLR